MVFAHRRCWLGNWLSGVVICQLVGTCLAWGQEAAPPPVSAAATLRADTYQVGLAEIDITPDYPIRLSGFGFRRTESTGVTRPLHAKALAVAEPGRPPVLLLLVENCTIPARLVETLVERLAESLPMARERVVVSCTHTHTGPMLAGSLATLFGEPIPAEHQRSIERYTKELSDKLVQVARQALGDLQPARMEWGVGTVDFAVNRRQRGGPVDHDLPVLLVRGTDGRVRGVLATYACHCVTLSDNRINGDWAGYAMEAVQRAWPGAVALVTIGCGADQNPASGVTGDRSETAAAQGAAIAAEVQRMAAGFMAPVSGSLVAQRAVITLPLATLPTRAQWEERARRNDATGYHARVQLERLGRGEQLPTKVDYPVHSWRFGDMLAMVFLPGEVVVDYAVRLKRELDPQRVWLHAYSNSSPGYVPSARILREGGYEGGDAMVYYDLPAGYAPGVEEQIVGEVHRQLADTFSAPWAADRLQGTRPLAPQQSLAALRVADEYSVELVVAEPLITDPVAVDFGRSGELWVAEMHDYPLGLRGDFEPGGRVRLVRDTDGDGRFDRSTIFLDQIPFPTGVLVWRRGVLVCTAPDILYAEDTDGDDRADVVRRAYSGFGTGNYQARVNSLSYGLDGWVYGSCGLFGGELSSFVGGSRLALGDRDFRVRPDDGAMEPATGRTQQGRARDDWGEWFGCDNSHLAHHYPLADHYLRRQPYLLAPPSAVSLTTQPEAARLFPLLSSAQRFQLSGPPAGVTAACGVGVYRDERLAGCAGNLFTCEPVNLLVHRLALQPQESSFQGRRAAGEEGREFLASTDPWWRPVQARTGPEGALWVVDMYRFVIEHPRWIPAADRSQIDVRAGSTHGRIYRVLPRGASPSPVPPRLDSLSLEQLVESLRSPNGTLRDLATQELVWRCTPSQLVPPGKGSAATTPSADVGLRPQVARLLQALLADPQARPTARLHALCLLGQWELETLDDVQRGLADPHPGVRRQAVRVAERWANQAAAEPLAARVLALAEDSAPQVRLQVALTLGQWRSRSAGTELGRLAVRHADDPYMVAAVLSSVRRDNVTAILDQVWSAPQGAESLKLLVPLLQTTVGLTEPGFPPGVLAELADRGQTAGAAWELATVSALLEAWTRRSRKLSELPAEDQERLAKLYESARVLVEREAAPVADRVAALGLLGRWPSTDRDETSLLIALVAPHVPGPVQSAAIEALARRRGPDTAERLLDRWSACTPELRSQVADVLLSRAEWREALLGRLERREISPATLDAARRQRLWQRVDPQLAARLDQIFDSPGNLARAQVLQEYQGVLTLAGDRQRGEAVVRRACLTCHRWRDAGHEVGPDLASVGKKSPAALLTEILDPNRNVDSRYLQYAAELQDGRTFQGLLASETATSITLLAAQGARHELLRADLETVQSLATSLMPEGLERDLSRQDLADVLALLATGGQAPKSFPGNSPTLVLGEQGQYALLATRAEISGGDIVFETPFRNIGYWHGEQDQAAWSVDVAAAGDFDVYLDASCAPDAAGNGYLLEAGTSSVRGRMASTGGWDKYQQERVGRITLPRGPVRVVLRPSGPLRGALADVRAIYLVPPGQPLRLSAVASSPAAPATPDQAALFLLDDHQPAAVRQAVIADHPAWSAELIVALTRDLPGEEAEEYRCIPWLWRVAIAAGKRPDPAEWKAIVRVSLPAPGEPLRHWQAVVVGGGLVNGISQQGLWPAEQFTALLQQDEALTARWQAVLASSAIMADDGRVPPGTRYDALRILALEGWDRRGAQLARYLARDAHPELQMGAVSGLSDIEAPAAATTLLAALPQLTEPNRRLAIAALCRTPGRRQLLQQALDSQRVEPAWLTAEQRALLQQK